VEKKYIRNESDNVWTGESGYFFIRWRKKRVQSLTEPYGVLANHDGDGGDSDTKQKV